jgi:hypothetical protein
VRHEKVEFGLLKFDWLQLQTRGKTGVSKEGKLAGSGKSLTYGNLSIKIEFCQGFVGKLYLSGAPTCLAHPGPATAPAVFLLALDCIVN